MDSEHDLTQLLIDARAGDNAAWDRFVALVYNDLRVIAHQHMSAQRPEHTLNTTGLVHECYLRISQGAATPKDRQHFLALASRVMRQVLVDHARERLTAKRGGGGAKIPLDRVEEEELAHAREFIELDEALAELGKLNERQMRVVEARFFGGLTEEETAEAIGVSLRLVQREWHEARTWLEQYMRE